MSISFNQVPNNLRAPIFAVEFDSSKAQKGTAIKSYKALMFGQKTSAGTATADVPVSVTSAAQASTLFGRGSFLHNMVRTFLDNNKFTSLTVIPQADNGAGVTAAGTLTVTGPATAAGTLSLYIAGQLIEIAVASGDAQNSIASAINTALGLKLDLPVSATVATNVVTLTCRHKGLLGNKIDVRFNYYPHEAFPAGVAVAIVAMTAGTTAPVLTTSISGMGETQYDVICCPYNDATSLTAVEAELLDRWGPVRQNDGMAFTAMDDTHANLVTFGDGRNSKHVSCAGIYKAPTPCYEIAAAVCAAVGYYGQQDPARPFQTLQLKSVLAPALANRFTLQERNLQLFDGIATLKVADSGEVLIDRLITMYQENSTGADDTAYLDVNTVLTLSFLRYSFRNRFALKYPRHKLADDTTRVSTGQAILTPKVARAEAISLFREWEDLGLVENIDQFKRDLVVERHTGDPNRLDFLVSPDLINQFIVGAAQIGFLL